MLSPCASWSASMLGHEPARPVLRNHIGAIEPDDVIDTKAVEEGRSPTRPMGEPFHMSAPRAVPAVCRHAPVLARFAEGIRRRAHRGIQSELVLVDPDIGAVGSHHEREVAEDGESAGRSPRLLPLFLRNPLHVLVMENVASEGAPRRFERRRLPMAERDCPLGPRPFAVRGVKSAKERIVIEPPRLAADELAQCTRTGRLPSPFHLVKTLEGQSKRPSLQAPHRVVRHVAGSTRLEKRRAALFIESVFATAGRKLGDCRHAHVLGIDGHGAQAGVWRLVARCGLVDRQQLQHAKPRGPKPLSKLREVGRLANTPALTRRHREEGNDYARAAPRLVRHLHETRSNTRRTPSANTPGSGSRLNTRYASPGKSKKYPG